MGTSLAELAKEAKQIIDKYGVVKNPENAVLMSDKMSDEEYFKLVEYTASCIPKGPKNWTPNLWNKFYSTVTDVIFCRNNKLEREDLTKEEKHVFCFEVATRPKKWDEYALAKDSWFSRVTGKDTNLPLDVATKRAAAFVEQLREESKEGFDAKDYLRHECS